MEVKIIENMLYKIVEIVEHPYVEEFESYQKVLHLYVIYSILLTF